MNYPGDTAIEKIAANVLETRFENFDAETLEKTKYRVIDTLGCLIGGSTDTGNPELVSLFRDTGGKEEATILIHDGKIPVGNAAFVNSVMARSFDFEPVSPLVDGFSCPGHISGTTVPTAVSMAESAGVDKQKVFENLIIYLAPAEDAIPYHDMATELNMTEGAVKVAVHRLRKHYRELLRDEIAQTVTSDDQIDEEIRDLFAAFGS